MLKYKLKYAELSNWLNESLTGCMNTRRKDFFDKNKLKFKQLNKTELKLLEMNLKILTQKYTLAVNC